MKIMLAALAALGLYFGFSSSFGTVTHKETDSAPTEWDGGTPPPVFPH